MILDKIIEDKKIELEYRKNQIPIEALKQMVSSFPIARNFEAALCGRGVKLIAEIKKASPSRGIIREDFNALNIAKTFAENGAAAISVLTEAKYFLGNLHYLSQIETVLGSSCPPLLRKDFILEPYQIYESRAFGADAVLLIAAVLNDKEIHELLALSHKLGMYCLLEVHNEEEAARAIDSGARIIGINNRDLQTFEVSLETTARLRPLLPADRIVVSESGIKTRDDLKRLENWGVNAALVGEVLMASEDIAAGMKELL
ncbi:MAG TPA: indole-3-glycerol phosphate synthase TrpC [Dehalococcoidales bacterium]|nr:indole-3-glycerol phosphate synthase TrpC [Dehalococcoidales bacterium]